MNTPRSVRFLIATVIVSLLACMPVSAAPSRTFPAKSLQALSWRLVGPFRGGRSVAVAGVPGKPRTFYFGGVDGGVWKTTDGGIHWHNVSDGSMDTGAIGALAVAPSDPNVIYAGTGEPFPRGNMATGNGVWKSTDAGRTWTHVGLEATRVVGDIVVDPRNPDHVYVAALGHVFGPNRERGVYESSDGGAHWKPILRTNQHAGAVHLVMDPGNPRVLYAAMWRVERRPWTFSSGGKGSGLYKSTDGGAHWHDLSRNPGMPRGVIGKIDVAVAASDPQRVYAMVEAKSGGLFRSNDAGKTWTRVYHKSNLTQRAWYFSGIYVDPKNPDRLYAPQVAGLFKSDDGGRSFKPLSTPHGDNHTLWINPRDPKILIVSNDGGAAVSYNGGRSWSSEDNQPTAQFYHVALDDQFPFHIYGAQQDNSTVEITSRNTAGSTIGDKDWRAVAGGESGFVIPVPGKPWITYGGGYDGALNRLDSRTGQDTFLDPWPDNAMGYPAKDLKYRFQWTFPIVVSRHDPKTLYVGSQYVMRSTDGGRTWKAISPDLTRNDPHRLASSGGPITQDNTSVEYYDTVFALAESPLKAGLLWAGTDDGRVWVKRAGESKWQDATPRGLPEWTTISSIDPSPLEPGTAFVAARRYRQDDYRPYVYKTTDYGRHWTRITRGLPDDQSSFVVRQDTRDADLLFAGTLDGVYVSFNGGAQWQPLQLNLPHTAVRDMAIQPTYDALVLATHGRAFWVLDNLEPLREMSRKALDEKAFLFTPQTAYLTGGGHSSDANKQGKGENPPNGVTVFYALKHAPRADEKVSLRFADAKGKTLATFSNLKTPEGKPVHEDKEFYPAMDARQKGVVPTRAGMNRFVWNLRVPQAKAIPDSVVWFGSMRGPRVPPGSYAATLTVGGTSYTRHFQVTKDPRSTATQADLDAQFAFLEQAHTLLGKVNESVLDMRALRKQIKAYQPRLKKGSEAARQAKAIIERLGSIEDALMQTQSHASEDPLNYPVRLRSKLATLAFETGASLGRPTQAEEAVWKELSGKAQAQLDAWHTLRSEQVPKLNDLIRKANLTPLTAKSEAAK